MPTPNEVRSALIGSGYPVVDEKALQQDGMQYRCQNGAVVNVYRTGTVQVQGKNREPVEKALGEQLGLETQ